jgi:hypothetical protein
VKTWLSQKPTDHGFRTDHWSARRTPIISIAITADENEAKNQARLERTMKLKSAADGGRTPPHGRFQTASPVLGAGFIRAARRKKALEKQAPSPSARRFPAGTASDVLWDVSPGVTDAARGYQHVGTPLQRGKDKQ